jgi:hypothetical protein
MAELAGELLGCFPAALSLDPARHLPAHVAFLVRCGAAEHDGGDASKLRLTDFSV